MEKMKENGRLKHKKLVKKKTTRKTILSVDHKPTQKG